MVDQWVVHLVVHLVLYWVGLRVGQLDLMRAVLTGDSKAVQTDGLMACLRVLLRVGPKA